LALASTHSTTYTRTLLPPSWLGFVKWTSASPFLVTTSVTCTDMGVTGGMSTGALRAVRGPHPSWLRHASATAKRMLWRRRGMRMGEPKLSMKSQPCARQCTVLPTWPRAGGVAAPRLQR
jgi:hypothetical protein